MTVGHKFNRADSLRARMTQEILLKIPGFEMSGRERPVVQYALDRRSCEEWYRHTEQLLVDQLAKGYFPVFRFSDGECYFCLGYRIPPPEPGNFAVWHYLRTALSAYVKYRCHTTFWSGLPGYGYEIYRGREWQALRPLFSAQLREIAQEGLISANFCSHTGFGLMGRYIPDIFDWFDVERIHLDSTNYIPFYFIYAMLLGPDRFRFLRRRKILVVTHLSEGKEFRLRNYLESSGASSVSFIGISRSSSMTDRIELRPEHEGTELVLVGAGVGAANILSQLKPLNTLSIDAGYVLECYQNPDFKGTRVYTMPDEEIGASSRAIHA